MKKHVLNKVVKRLFAGNMLAALLFLSANASVSPVHYNNYELTKNNKAVVTFKGTDNDDYMTFQVVYNNPRSAAFNLSITDGAGEVIFSEKYYDVAFSKTFKLLKDDINKLNFTIRNIQTSEIEKFSVNVNSFASNNVEVTRNNNNK